MSIACLFCASAMKGKFLGSNKDKGIPGNGKLGLRACAAVNSSP